MSTSQPEEISVTDLRRRFPEVIGRIQLLGDSFKLMKNGREFAMLSPIRGGEEAARRMIEAVQEDPDQFVDADEVLGAQTTA